mgnify:CR=1 FL=1
MLDQLRREAREVDTGGNALIRSWETVQPMRRGNASALVRELRDAGFTKFMGYGCGSEVYTKGRIGLADGDDLLEHVRMWLGDRCVQPNVTYTRTEKRAR